MSFEDYEALISLVDELLSIPEDEFLKKIEDVNILEVF